MGVDHVYISALHGGGLENFLAVMQGWVMFF